MGALVLYVNEKKTLALNFLYVFACNRKLLWKKVLIVLFSVNIFTAKIKQIELLCLSNVIDMNHQGLLISE